jgi:NAD(P)-dependent dehydrogenase (short-subunit alcohol dehydrogenase family)
VSGPRTRLEGKVAVITGTGGGQGRAAARLFAQEGAIVVGGDVKADGAEETVALVRDAGGVMTSTHPLDLADRSEVTLGSPAPSRRTGRSTSSTTTPRRRSSRRSPR